MARISNLSTKETVELDGRTIFGRSPRADRRLQGNATSAEHAVIDWDGSAWALRDLASTNGTRINERRIGGKPKRLVVGDIVTFGDPEERWRWDDPTPPLPRAMADDGTAIVGSPTLLQLPSPRNPKVSIFWNGNAWEMDSGSEQRVVASGERVSIGKTHLQLRLPSLDAAADPTLALEIGGSVASSTLTFDVSLDRENVAMTLRVGERKHDFATRAFNGVLFELARVRLDERSRGVPESEAGWTYTDTLARALGTTVQKLNVDVHRARAAFAQTKLVSDASSVIQRRQNTGQLRLGIERLVLDGATSGETVSKNASRRARTRRDG